MVFKKKFLLLNIKTVLCVCESVVRFAQQQKKNQSSGANFAQTKLHFNLRAVAVLREFFFHLFTLIFSLLIFRFTFFSINKKILLRIV